MKSLIAYFILSIFLVIFSFTYYPKYNNKGTEATISWDVSGYYWYLPAAFIYKDLKQLSFTDSIQQVYYCAPDNGHINYLPEGKKVLKYSCGMALQYLPFFIIAHLTASSFGYPADGFSTPYQLALHVGAIFMMFIGLYYLRKILLSYFKDATVAWVLFFLAIGTNYINYMAIDVGMSHCWLFTWYCLLIYQTQLFYKTSNRIHAVYIGLILGLMTLTRPTEIIASMIPLLWGVSLFSRSSIRERFLYIKNNFTSYLIAIILMILIGCIQLLYWKYASGSWIVYSYGDQEFTWLQPHFRDYIFSYRCGWLVYCPLMIFSIVGLIFLYRKAALFSTIIAFSIAYVWIVAAWDIWWYGGRAMIQGYAILLFPFAAFIEKVNTKRLFQCIIFPIAFLFMYLNIWWVHGSHKGGYMYEGNMSKKYYQKIVGKWHIQEQDRKLLDVDDDYTGNITNADTLLIYNFDKGAKYERKNLENQPYLKIYKNELFEANYTFTPRKKNNWVRVYMDVYCQINSWDIIRMCKFGLAFNKNEKNIKYNYLLLDRLFYKEKVQRVYMDVKIDSETYDTGAVFISNRVDAQGEFLVSNLVVISFEGE